MTARLPLVSVGGFTKELPSGDTISGFGSVTNFSAGDLSPLFTTSEANTTTTPALTFAQISQSQNLGFMTPNGSSGVPTFRALVAADIPNLSAAKITSGLTNTRIPFFNGTSLVDDSNLVWDNTNKRVGIGSPTPTSPIHSLINSADGLGLILENSGASGTNKFFHLFQAGSTGYGVTDWPNASVIEATASGGLVFDGLAAPIKFQVARSLIATISSVGVGIGLTPVARLDVKALAAGNIVQRLTAHASQSANIWEVTNSALTVLAFVGSDGKLHAGQNAETFAAAWDGKDEPALKDDLYPVMVNIPTPLFNHYADAGNSGTSETDLYADTIPAATLDTNGKKIEATVAGSFVLSATATRQLKVKFGASGSETTIFDSGLLSVSIATDFDLDIMIIRESSTVVRCRVLASTTSASAIPYVTITRITGLTLSSATVLKVTGQSAGVGAATNDIIAKIGTGEVVP